MLIYFGHRTVMSLAALNELALMFVPTVAKANANEAKKAAARPPELPEEFHALSMNLVGSQRVSW